MSTEEVSVSLSRLALAKAIKTPDTNEEEAEPWSKSVIFHQSHIDAQMRNSIINPMSNKNRRRQPQPFKQKHMHTPPPMNRARSEELYKQPKPYPQQRSTSALNHQPRSSQSSSGNSSLSSGKLAQYNNNKINNTKSGRRYMPSDDEDDDDEEEEDSDDEEEEDDEKEKKQAPKLEINKPKVNNKPQKQDTKKIVVPSDEEGSDKEATDEESETNNISKDKGKQPESDETFARRMSTLRQLEQGTSIRKARSVDEAMEPPITDGKLGSIEQWRMTVLEADDTSSAPGSEQDYRPSPSLRQSKASSKRASNMSDMYYLQQQQQQQQHMYNMQLQQAMQMQQMMQIQQYQQQAAIHQYRNSMMVDRQHRHKKASSSRLLNNVPEHGIPRSNHRRSQMMDGPPMPTISMSTPVHHHRRVTQQHMPMPVMKPSRSSHMSKRTSTLHYN